MHDQEHGEKEATDLEKGSKTEDTGQVRQRAQESVGKHLKDYEEKKRKEEEERLKIIQQSN